MDWQLAVILAVVTALMAWIVWDVIAPLVNRRTEDAIGGGE